MNTCSLFMSNASRHQLDRPLYLPGRHPGEEGNRITYYVFIFFSPRARPLIKGAPPRICPDDLAAILRRPDKMGQVDNEAPFGISRVGSSSSRLYLPLIIFLITSSYRSIKFTILVSRTLCVSYKNFISGIFAKMNKIASYV